MKIRIQFWTGPISSLKCINTKERKRTGIVVKFSSKERERDRKLTALNYEEICEISKCILSITDAMRELEMINSRHKRYGSVEGPL